MNRPTALAVALLLSVSAAPVLAQDTTVPPEDAEITGQSTRGERTRTPVAPVTRTGSSFRSAIPNGEPDVLLDIPNLSVDEIKLDVQNLRAKVALDARLANLLALSAGADVSIERVNITIKGVKATVLLKVRLDNVAAIIDRTLTTIDRNPQLLERLLKTVDTTVGTVGGVANTALRPGGVVSQTVGAVDRTLGNVTQPGGVLSETVNALGQTVQRTVDSAGNIVERTLDASGKVIDSKVVGRAPGR